MRMPVWSGLLAILLLAPAARAQETAGPWHDCDFPTISITVESDTLLPGIAPGRRLTALCFTHAIRGSSLLAGQVRLELLSPPIVRGDLVAFRRPDDISKTAIRRVIGLPGDKVQLREFRLVLNDALLRTDRLGDAVVSDPQGHQIRAARMHETIVRGIRGYDILLPQDTTDGGGNSDPFIVPPRFIYLLPDNRVTAERLNLPVFGIVPVVNLIALVQVPPTR